jgi:hypothetical protein
VKSQEASETNARKKVATKKAVVKVRRTKAAKKSGKTRRDYEE